MDQNFMREMPIGAELQADHSVHFRVWAPSHTRLRVVLENHESNAQFSIQKHAELTPEGNGYFSGAISDLRAGQLYRYLIDNTETPYPDPASRCQPYGPFGPSCVIDRHAYAWNDRGFKGLALKGQVLYEMHIGTFTIPGTWQAAVAKLPDLADLGITALEIMPVAEFPGEFGWGYDGVCLFAPFHGYGAPDDFRRFVDKAHALGMGVILDVVYNHLGNVGCFVNKFSDFYYSTVHSTEWGDALNFDGPNSAGVRELVIANCCYWCREFHVDGFRLDATHSIFDDSKTHVLAELSQAVHSTAGARPCLLIAESESQDASLIRPVTEGGKGFDAVWNDDFHHSARVALTGRHEAYYSDYRGTPQELISLVKYGYLYQGQYYAHQKKKRGTPALGCNPAQFVTYLQNHDQVANSSTGQRCHQLGSPGRYRALTALLLLGPGTPLLFQGQEYGEQNPFLYFADIPENHDLRRMRAQFLSQFPTYATSEAQAGIADPIAAATFNRSKLSSPGDPVVDPVYLLHRDLLLLRAKDPVFAMQTRQGCDGVVLGPELGMLRFFGKEHGDRILIVNLGPDHDVLPMADPLFAPPPDTSWTLLWSSESVRYGGLGTAPLMPASLWHITAQAAQVLKALP